MGIETRRDKLIYHGFIPVLGAILGAIAATWFQSANLDNSQLHYVVTLLKDPALSAQEKLQALEIYKEITDRPWSVIRSIVTFFGISLGSLIGAMTVGGFFSRSSDK
jgi:hypothetical protein